MEDTPLDLPITPCPGRFPIVAANAFPATSQIKDSDVANLLDCNFNVGIMTTSVERFLNIFGKLAGTDFKLILGSPYLHENEAYFDYTLMPWQDFAYEFSAYPSETYDYNLQMNPNLGGWCLSECAQTQNLETLKEEVKRFRDAKNALSARDQNNPERNLPPAMVYINFSSNIITRYAESGKSFANSAKEINNELNIAPLCFSYFPIEIIDRKININYGKFYRLLENVSKSCQESGIPFWVQCQTQAFLTQIAEYPIPLESYIRFIVFSSLGYGAQGIVHRSFVKQDNTTSEIYTMAPVDQYGNKTPVWYSLKKVNSEIRKYENVFLGAEHISSIHTALINPTKEDDSPGPVFPYGPIKKIYNDDMGVQLSLLKNKGNQYLLIVNQDVERFQDIRIMFTQECTVFNLITNTPASSEKILPMALSPGGYLIFEYKKNA